jgi:hypothetical protein
MLFVVESRGPPNAAVACECVAVKAWWGWISGIPPTYGASAF